MEYRLSAEREKVTQLKTEWMKWKTKLSLAMYHRRHENY